MPTHAPSHLVTHFESVSAFLSYPAPGYPGRDPPLESYLSQRRLWSGRGTSRVRLPYTGAITMALKPPFPSLYHYSLVIRGLRPSHGVAPSMVFPTHGCRGVALWSPCFCVIPPWRHPARRRLILVMLPLGDASFGDACAWRHPTWATPALSVTPPGRRLTLSLTSTLTLTLMLTLTLTSSTPGYGTIQVLLFQLVFHSVNCIFLSILFDNLVPLVVHKEITLLFEFGSPF